MAVDPTALKTLIDATPAAKAKADAGDHAGCAAVLNEPTESIPKAYRITTRGVMDVLGAQRGTAVLDALEAAGAQVPVYRRVYKMIEQLADGGVDLSHADAPALLASMVQAGIATQAEADTLLALARESCGLARKQLGSDVTHRDVREAMKGGA